MSLTGRILTRIFALFGMTLTCVACYAPMDAEFRPEFIAYGRVVDNEGKPIEGIEASIQGGYSSTSGSDGYFWTAGNSNQLHLIDIDGEENGGAFEGVDITLTESNETDVGIVTLRRIGEEVTSTEEM